MDFLEDGKHILKLIDDCLSEQIKKQSYITLSGGIL